MRVVFTNLPTFAFSVGFPPFRCVVMGRYAMHLTQPEVDAIISHETAHIIHRDALKRVWWLWSLKWLRTGWLTKACREQEFDADAFAVRAGHYEGLVKFLGRCTILHENPLHPTVPERIANITRLHHGPDRTVPTAG